MIKAQPTTIRPVAEDIYDGQSYGANAEVQFLEVEDGIDGTVCVFGKQDDGDLSLFLVNEGALRSSRQLVLDSETAVAFANKILELYA